MNFRTVINPVTGLQGLVGHGEPLLLVGSCFSDNIGACLRDDLFEVDVNPFGPVYNPLSILRSFEILAEGKMIDEESLVERDGMFHSFLFHSRFSGSQRGSTVAQMNRRIRESGANLRRARVIIVTLGTTRCFSLRSSGEVVANCHKLPASIFDARYLDLDEVTEALRDIVETIRKVNTEATVIFTVSPLRYLERGAHANQLSKATLLLAVDRIIRETGGAVGYFPAYEIMMDDLRDYRFYAEDMKHPSDQAVRYIYDLFKATYCDPATIGIAREASAFTRRMRHAVTTLSTEAAERERSERELAQRSLIGLHPELKVACQRYINSF